MSGLHAVPLTWKWTTLQDVAEVITGNTPPTSNLENYGGSIPFFKPPQLNDIPICEAPETLSEKGLAKARLLPPKSVLVSCIGILGKTAITKTFSATNQQINAVVFESLLQPEYGFYYTQTLGPWLKEHSSATTVAIISKGKFSVVPFPLPPAPEQTRIVEKLEELLSDLDAGVAELKAAQAKLVRYRQSLLKAAVEGALTAEWRQHNTPEETGAQLLQRILTERRARWEAKLLGKFAEQGKSPPKDWQKKYPEPVQPDIRDLPELPVGWVWASLSQVGWLDRGKSKHRPRNAPHLYGGPYPFVQTGDIRHSDTFITSSDATYSEAGLAQSRLWPIGTMCITIAANIGKTAILSMEACFPDSVVGFLPATDELSLRYIEYSMRTIQQKLEEEAPATAQKNINLEILERSVIPIPPANEQTKIVEFLEKLFTTSTENNRAILLCLKQSTAQRKNILRAAFSGQLVPQDPNDEPASALLAHIRAGRATDASTTLRRRKRTDAGE